MDIVLIFTKIQKKIINFAIKITFMSEIIRA